MRGKFSTVIGMAIAVALLATGCKKDEEDAPAAQHSGLYNVKLTVNCVAGYTIDAAMETSDGGVIALNDWVEGDTTLTGTCTRGAHLFLIIANGGDPSTGHIYVDNVQVAGSTGDSLQTHSSYYDIP